MTIKAGLEPILSKLASGSPPQKMLLDKWNYSGLPSVQAFNHAVDVANANYQRALAAEAQLASGAPQRTAEGWRTECGKHRYEDAGMEIVKFIKKHIAPDIDENDVGEILWQLTQFAERIWNDARSSAPGITPPQEDK